MLKRFLRKLRGDDRDTEYGGLPRATAVRTKSDGSIEVSDARLLEARTAMLRAMLDNAAEHIDHAVRTIDSYGGPLDTESCEMVTDLALRVAELGGQEREDSARRLLERVLDAQTGDELAASATMVALGGVLQSSNSERAMTLGRRALEIRERHEGKSALSTGEAANALASILSNTGRVDESLGLYQRALEIFEQDGSDPSRTALCANNLAVAQLQLGNVSQARVLVDKAIALREASGSDNANLARCYDTLGGIQTHQRDFEGAIRSRRKAVDLFRPFALGQAHPELGRFLGNLAGNYLSANDLDNAERFMVESLEVRREALGASHPSVARPHNDLAIINARRGRWDAAEEHASRNFEICKAALGPGHPQAHQAGELLANIQMDKARHGAAVEPRYLSSRIYSPLVKTFNVAQSFDLGSYEAILLKDIVSDGKIDYLYILVAREKDNPDPCFIVASEVNQAAPAQGGSHFMGVFAESGHSNLGDSDEWGNEALFVSRALQVIREHFGLR